MEDDVMTNAHNLNKIIFHFYGKDKNEIKGLFMTIYEDNWFQIFMGTSSDKRSVRTSEGEWPRGRLTEGQEGDKNNFK